MELEHGLPTAEIPMRRTIIVITNFFPNWPLLPPSGSSTRSVILVILFPVLEPTCLQKWGRHQAFLSNPYYIASILSIRRTEESPGLANWLGKCVAEKCGWLCRTGGVGCTPWINSMWLYPSYLWRRTEVSYEISFLPVAFFVFVFFETPAAADAHAATPLSSS